MHSILNLLLALPAVLAVATIDKRQTKHTIPGAWIVRLNDDAPLSTAVSSVMRASGITPKHQYNISSFKGFAFHHDGDDSVLDLIANIASIKSIEPDTYVYTSAPATRRVKTQAITTQSPAEWGLARISHKAKGSSGYIYDSSAGTGMTAYIIDTGILATHNEFGGRAVMGANFISGETAVDGNGHGTHCAGTIGGSTYGVAKNVSLIGVKVLSSQGSGSNSGVIAGIQWAVNGKNILLFTLLHPYTDSYT